MKTHLLSFLAVTAGCTAVHPMENPRSVPYAEMPCNAVPAFVRDAPILVMGRVIEPATGESGSIPTGHFVVERVYRGPAELLGATYVGQNFPGGIHPFTSLWRLREPPFTLGERAISSLRKLGRELWADDRVTEVESCWPLALAAVEKLPPPSAGTRPVTPTTGPVH